MWDNEGHWLEWTVISPEGGLHELAITHASQTHAVREVLLNRQPVKGLDKLAFNATGGWRSFITTGAKVALPLNKGKNVIRFTNVSGSLNFRMLEFIPVTSDIPHR